MLKHLIFVLGNHDKWFIDWFTDAKVPDVWFYQGGSATIDSYDQDPKNVPNKHKDFFKSAKPYHIEKDMLFVHGGFEIDKPIEKQELDVLLWDRAIIGIAQKQMLPGYKKVFIGHSATQGFNDYSEPVFLNNLVMLDTGAGWNGKLTLMNIENEEYWQSDWQMPNPGPEFKSRRER